MNKDRLDETQINSDLMNVIQERIKALQRLKKRKKHPFKSKLSRCANVIFILRDGQSVSYELIRIYLWKHHKIKTTRCNVRHFYLSVKAEAEIFQSSDIEPNYWGLAGSNK